MFQNIGWTEILIVVAVLLVLFGGKYLLKFGKKIKEYFIKLWDAIKDFFKSFKSKDKKEK